MDKQQKRKEQEQEQEEQEDIPDDELLRVVEHLERTGQQSGGGAQAASTRDWIL